MNMGYMEDDGPIAVRDFPTGCGIVAGGRRETGNRLVEGDNGVAKLPDNFGELSPRDQFLERRLLFDRLCRDYVDMHRPDLQAMRDMSNVSFKFREFGTVPGIEVGDRFNYRAEMCVVGLHRAVEAGIACISRGDDKIACSIVFSGGYKDDVDHGDVIVYTGHGGSNKRRLGKREDQKYGAGNQALLHSLEYKLPVRVIRGRENGRNKSEIMALKKGLTPYKRYSYDGLYTVEAHVFEEGMEGHKVHKFTLRRNAGQPALSMISVASF